jgi:broad specificity phosphatase PhoE
MRLYFTRHGESEANQLRIISNRDLPHPLTAAGRQQAEELAEKLRGRSISRIYTSPIQRARETAGILSAVLGVSLEISDALREPDCGVLEGRGDEETWTQLQYWINTWLDGQERDQGPQGGETYNAIRERLVNFIDKLVAEYGESQAEFVLVTHGALMLFGLPNLVADLDARDLMSYGIGHTQVIALEWQAGMWVRLDEQL